MYIAVKVQDLKKPYLLTSDVMRVSNVIWIFNLTPALNFWNYHCAQQKKALSSLLEEILFQSDIKVERAVLGRHPWHVFLQTFALEKRSFTGMFSLVDLFNARLYYEMSFDVWFEAAEAFECYLADKLFKKNLLLFKRSVARLALKKISDLKEASTASFKRRYGKAIAKLLDWTFQKQVESSSALFCNDFPWEKFKEKPLYYIKRNLDYMVTAWGEISYLLKEDLQSLAASLPHLVLKMRWKIVLQPFSEREVEICFRNPHNLKHEDESFNTTLRQFEAAFHKISKELSDIQEQLVLSSWTIEVSEFMEFTCQEKNIFTRQDAVNLLDLENKMEVPLEKFTLERDFTPEYSFAKLSVAQQIERSKDALGRGLRPLFIFDKPREISDRAQNLIFTERVTTHWWDDVYQVRDYYFEVTQKPRWIFWDHLSRRWYEHGLFG